MLEHITSNNIHYLWHNWAVWQHLSLSSSRSKSPTVTLTGKRSKRSALAPRWEAVQNEAGIWPFILMEGLWLSSFEEVEWNFRLSCRNEKWNLLPNVGSYSGQGVDLSGGLDNSLQKQRTVRKFPPFLSYMRALLQSCFLWPQHLVSKMNHLHYPYTPACGRGMRKEGVPSGTC